MEETVSSCPSFAYYESAKVVPDAEATDARNPLGTSTDSNSEFAFVLGDYDVTADEIFVRDQIFPIFNRDLLIHNDLDQSDGKRPTELTLRHLSEKSLVDDIIAIERDPTTLLSSLELDAGELDSEPEEMYCIWRPKVVKKSPSRSKKSNSTGSSASKQGKLRYFLQRRSNSEGTREDSFVFLTPENGEQKAERHRRVETGKAKTKKKLSSAHEVFYVRNRAWKEGEKRKSYLPYRQDLMEDVPESEAVSFNPGFNFYSPCRCVDIAAEVTDEQEPSETSTDSDDYIEFTFVCREGQIHQTFSIFNRDPLELTDQDQSDKKPTEFSPRLELEKSVADDRGEGRDPPSFSSEVDELESVPVEEDCIWKPTLIDSSSRCKKCNSMSSSSEVDELEGVPVEEYCIWKPRLVESSSRYKKCNSTGSASKKWKLSDLLLHCRSNSEGKDSFLLLALKNRELKAEKQGRLETQSDKKPTELSLRLQLEKPSADDSGKGRDPPPLSSEVDESESVLVEEYCIWRPKVVDSSRRFKKCNSTGSALKQWQLPDLFLLRRSNSEGKEDLFLAPKNRELKDEKPGRVETQSNKKPTELSLRLQLEKLSAADDSSQGRDPPPSSEVDELESLPVEKYCVWRPKVVDSSRRFKKCNSTGSVSKQWKLLDLLLLRRSNSEGKDSSFVFPTLKNREPNADKQGRVETQSNKKPSELSLRLQLEKPSAADDSGQERDPPLSSEVDELESVPLEEYCVWRPKVVDSSRRFKKCNSTGSVSKQWKLLDLLLLRRSNSEGREDSFVFLTPKNREVKVSAHEQGRVETKKARKAKVSAHEVFYLQNRAWKEEEKRKTYLPYRQDLVGFFAKANVVGTTYPQRQTYMGSHGGTSSA